MSLRVIELDQADNFYSVRNRLLQGDRARTVLIWPRKVDQFGGVDLVLLRRLADRERLDIGLVTSERELARQARAVGLPTFANLTLAERYRPGWWRAGRRSEWLGFAPGAGIQPTSESNNTRFGLWVWVAFLSALLLLGLVMLAILYFIPRATIRLYPVARPVQVILDLTADTARTDLNGPGLPARAVDLTQAWQASGSATGDDTADRQRIRAQAFQGVGAAAPGLLAARLNPGEILVPGSVHTEVIEESFAAEDATTILTLRVLITGAAVRLTDLNRLAHRELARTLPAGYEPDGGSLRLWADSLPDADPGHFQLTAQATGQMEIDPLDVARMMRGQRMTGAIGRLSETIPMAQPPVVDFRPGWWWEFGRFPLRPDNIDVEVRP